MKKGFICVVVFCFLLLMVGCSGKFKTTGTSSAYFSLEVDCSNEFNLKAECDNICETSNVRILNYVGDNEIIEQEGEVVCRCY